MAIYVANNGQLQTIKGIYYGMTEDYINARLFHNLVPKTATEIKFLYASNNPDLTDYQRIGYCDNNNFIEVWKSGTKYILINPRKNYIYAPTSCSYLFTDYTALTLFVFNNFNTQNVSDMSGMLYGCNKLTSVDLSSFNTANVRNMQGMFSDCKKLTTLDLSNFNTANVRNMSYLLSGCNKLVTIVSNTFNTAVPTTSSYMFLNCTSLVGGNGTNYSSSHITAEYARVDGENGLAGYFTAPTN